MTGVENEKEISKKEAIEKSIKFIKRLPKELQEDYIDVISAFYSYGFNSGAHEAINMIKTDLIGGINGNELLPSEEDQ